MKLKLTLMMIVAAVLIASSIEYADIVSRHDNQQVVKKITKQMEENGNDPWGE